MRDRVMTVCKITIGLVFAMALEILPLPSIVALLRPQWVLLVLAFFALREAGGVSVGIAFIVGLFMDLLLGTVLGLHALAYVFSVYLCLKIKPRFLNFSLSMQMLSIVPICAVTLLIINVTDYHWIDWLPLVSNGIVWAWFGVLLHDHQTLVSRRY